jgi:hypothetical protein
MLTTVDQPEHCPHCGERLLKISRKLKKLALENEQLQEDLAELVELLEHMEVHTYVGSSSRAHFHRPECKWIRDISPQKLVEFVSHKKAVAAGRKPCKTCRA